MLGVFFTGPVSHAVQIFNIMLQFQKTLPGVLIQRIFRENESGTISA